MVPPLASLTMWDRPWLSLIHYFVLFDIASQSRADSETVFSMKCLVISVFLTCWPTLILNDNTPNVLMVFLRWLTRTQFSSTPFKASTAEANTQTLRGRCSFACNQMLFLFSKGTFFPTPCITNCSYYLSKLFNV